MGSKSYWVDSELNPQYTETGNMADYYGIYYVVETDEQGNSRRIETMTNEYGSAEARNMAYRRVVELYAQRTSGAGEGVDDDHA